MMPLNDRIVFIIIAICIVICLFGPFIITFSERKNFNRLIDKLSFISVPKSGTFNWSATQNVESKIGCGTSQFRTNVRNCEVPPLTCVRNCEAPPLTCVRGADFIKQYAKSFDLIFTSHYSWYHPFVEYFTGSIWTHSAILYRPTRDSQLYVIEVTTVDSYNKRDNRNRRGLSIETFDTWLSFHDKETQLLMLQFSNSEIGYQRYCEIQQQQINAELPRFTNEHASKVLLSNYHSVLTQRCKPNFLKFIDSLVNVRMNTGLDFIAPVWKQKYDPDRDSSIGPQANCSEFVAFFLQQFGFLQKRYRPRCYAPGDLVYTNDFCPYLKTTFFRIEL